MSRAACKVGLKKFQRYRASQKQRGTKLVRLWVPDPDVPGFRREARRQALLLHRAAEELRALDLIEAVGDFTE